MSEAREWDTEIKLACGSYLPPLTGPFDAGSAVTAIGNLIDNAMEAGASRVEIAFRCGERHLAIAVTDDGPGIAPEIRERLFERGVTTRGEGRGYGLANVREAIEAAGGSLSLVATSETGTTIELQVPREGAA